MRATRSKLLQLAATATDDTNIQHDVLIALTVGARLALRDPERMAGVLETEVGLMGTVAGPMFRAMMTDLVDEAVTLFDMMDKKEGIA